MTDLIIPRRKFLLGLASLVAAPAVVRAASLMPVRVVPLTPVVVGLDVGLTDYSVITLYTHGRQILTFPYEEGWRAVTQEMATYGEAMYRTEMRRDDFQAKYLDGLVRHAAE